jgi:hypothetical protein
VTKVHKTVASLLAKILLKKKLLKAREFGGLNGLDLAKECCDPEGFEWTEGSWDFRSRLYST